MKTKINCLVTLLATSFTCSAIGATVQEVNIKKKTATVELEANESFEKGAAVCFFDDSDTKGECGTVARIKDSSMLVKVKKPKKIKIGMKVKSDGDAAAASDTASDEASAEKTEKKSSAKKTANGPKSPLRITGIYGFAISTPASFNKIAYAAPESETTAPTTLWSKEKVVSSTALGFGFEVAVPIGRFAIVPGLRYRLFTPSLTDSDKTKKVLYPYMSTEVKASALGFYTDFQLAHFSPATVLGINLLAGLDVDMSTVTVKTTEKTKEDTTSDAASATSKLSVLSLRLGANADILPLKLGGLRLALGLMIPATTFGASFSGTVADSRGLTTDAATDLKAAIGHKKSSFGAEADIGLVLAF